MKLPFHIQEDLEKILFELEPYIKHYGFFGSVLTKGFEKANDIDMIFVFDGISYEEICGLLEKIDLNIPYVTSYRNYMTILSEAIPEVRYYDMVFIPEKKPDREFLEININKIQYLTTPFTCWREKNEFVLE